MTKKEKQQLAAWALQVWTSAQRYADIVDPKREQLNRVGNKLDAITRLAREIDFELSLN